MSLDEYFRSLIERVEASNIQNDGTDENGFYKPTRALLLRHLNLLRDLHDKPLAQPMLRASWANVVKHLPPDWLVLTPVQKDDLKKMLG
jgi:hypothetical protein